MRWLWIDRILLHERGRRLVAIKNVSLAEEHLHDHFAADRHGPAQPLMPGSLIIEGMAQTGGILVGAANDFREKVVLAKIAVAELAIDVAPGHTIRYDATIDRIEESGANTTGVIDRLDPATGIWARVGHVELMFSHLDHNRAGRDFPEGNFVFGPNFAVVLDGLRRASGG